MKDGYEGEVLGRAIKKAVREDVETHFLPSLQSQLDMVYRTFRGHPVEEVASVLATVVPIGGQRKPQAWVRAAAAISRGRRVRVELKMPSGW